MSGQVWIDIGYGALAIAILMLVVGGLFMACLALFGDP